MGSRACAASALAVAALAAYGLVGLTPTALAAGPAKPYDFNGDGFRDVALGSPYGTVGTVANAGFVTILYGSASGTSAAKKQVVSQSSAGVAGSSEAGDHWGYSVASADFDGDGYADLAVGAPEEDYAYTADDGTAATATDGGGITVIYGSPSGLSATSVWLAEPKDPEGNNKGPGNGHRLGLTLAAGDFDKDGTPTLVASSPGAATFYELTVPAKPTAAQLKTLLAKPAKAAFTAHKITPSADPSAKAAKAGTLAAAADPTTKLDWISFVTGDVTGDGFDDVAMGWADDDVSPYQFGVTVYPGGAQPFVDTAGTVPLVELGDVATGDFDGDGHADVAVSAPSDAKAFGGLITVYRGAAAGIDEASAYSISQDTAGVPGGGEAGDRFGYSIAAGDANGDGKADLAVGAPSEDIGTIADAGGTWMLYGSASGLTGTGAGSCTQDSTGVPGAAEKSDRYGWSVAMADTNGDGDAEMVSSAPFENGSEGYALILPGSATGTHLSGLVAYDAPSLGLSGQSANLGIRLNRT
ncbi:MAG TPA: FG-GAP-like repeat-containing protein [Streptosporangiaceae bacterium]|jgi:hypothetical protein